MRALSIVAVLLMAPAMAWGAIVASHQPVSGGGVTRWSQLWQDPSGNGNDLDTDAISWTDFVLSEPRSINHIEWWGKGASELGFRIDVWKQDPGTIAYQPLAVFDVGPGPSTVTPNARLTVSPGDFTTEAGPGGITHFLLDLPSPIDLPANNSSNPRWFIGIIGLTSEPATWDWSQSIDNTNHTFQWIRADGSRFHSLGDGRAIMLSDATVPEPFNFVLLYAGVAILTLRRPVPVSAFLAATVRKGD